jgi:hypothetical protein
MEIHGFRWSFGPTHQKKKEKKFLSLSSLFLELRFYESFGASRTGSLDFFLLCSRQRKDCALSLSLVSLSLSLSSLFEEEEEE